MYKCLSILMQLCLHGVAIGCRDANRGKVIFEGRIKYMYLSFCELILHV
jgi:hypothetical protein